MNRVSGERDQVLCELVRLLNAYKLYIEWNLIFESPDDFLYRQSGQLKLANSSLEEFLPRLFDDRLVPGLAHVHGTSVQPASCFSHLSFGSPLLPLGNGGVFIKCKNQDFAVTKKYELSITATGTEQECFQKSVSIAYFATEVKTNLDKTMFQEATATAGELKTAVPGAKYVLLCEWLDMSPIDTKLTPIDEVIVLRRNKRIRSNLRDEFGTADGRRKHRGRYESFLMENPLHIGGFERFLDHLNQTFPVESGPPEQLVLERGYF